MYFNKTLNAKYKATILIKNNPGSSFISFACSNIIIGIDMKIVETKRGIFRRVLLFSSEFDFNKSQVINTNKINDINHQTLFRKKAKVGELNKYHIHVKVCQDIIVHKTHILFASAINFQKFI